MNNLKVIFMAKETTSSIAALQYLIDIKVEVVRAVVRNTDYKLQEICKANSVIMCREDELLLDYTEGKIVVDYIFSFYWKKIKCEILQIPERGGINFHPGPLPEARGSGYHIAILENWGYWGVTAHFMDAEYDTGAIIASRRFPIANNIVNRDLVTAAHKQLLVLFKDIVNMILENQELSGKMQEEGRYFSLSELERLKFIDEKDDTEQIDRKIRAFWNPPYRGAQVEIKGKKYTLINEEILAWINKELEHKEKISNGEVFTI